jgi:hypothetical protein
MIFKGQKGGREKDDRSINRGSPLCWPGSNFRNTTRLRWSACLEIECPLEGPFSVGCRL